MIYTVDGGFFEGMDWEDFRNKRGLVNFTIKSGDVAEGPVLADDGFVDITITEPLTRSAAEKVISDYIGMNVTVVDLGICMARPNNLD